MIKELPIFSKVESQVDFSKYELQFKALADQKRLQIMYELTQKGSVCVCDLVDIVNMPQSKLSYLYLPKKRKSTKRMLLVTHTGGFLNEVLINIF